METRIYTLTDVHENTNHISLQYLDEEKSWMRVKFHDANSRSVVMVKKQVFFTLPIIVNFCPASRCTEWNFYPKEKLGVNKIQAIPQ